MIFKINWDDIALESYIAETEYILLKWNYKEVEKFKLLVDENLNRLSKNPRLGKSFNNSQIYSYLISKQTTLYYSFSSENLVIDLYLFWNNQKNPEELNKLL